MSTRQRGFVVLGGKAALIMFVDRTLEESAREEVAFLKNSAFLRPELKGRITGYVYDLETGRLNAV